MSTSLKATARQAGFIYLLILVLAPLNEFFLKARFTVKGDAIATAQRIAAEPVLYRLGVFSDLVSHVAFLLLALLLYHLFRDVSRRQARLLIALVAMSVAIGMIALVCRMAPLILLDPANSLSVFSPAERDSLAWLFLRLGSTATVLATFFWGFWLLPFGSLVIKSRFYPKLLGVLLIVGGVTYAVLGFTNLVFPAYGPLVFKFGMPFYAMGELAIIFWLLFATARIPETPVASAAADLRAE
ncbi:MAG: DUF4386 domain-containing protein [Candidatus Didemnitutus sp.]|nr:DUF4386 domain-containing protein [Candidatus Didemnitutus sp.]